MLYKLCEKYKDLNWMTYDQACVFDDIIKQYSIKNVLELGHARGKISLLIASILKEVNGHLTTLNQIKDETVYPGWNDSIFRILEDENLLDYVTIFKSQRNWYSDLLSMCIKKQKYDLIYLDGDHTINGLAADFLFAESLLNPNGIIIFDDINWSLETSPAYQYFKDIHALGNTYTMMNDSEYHTKPVDLFCTHMLDGYIKIFNKDDLAVYQKIDK